MIGFGSSACSNRIAKTQREVDMMTALDDPKWDMISAAAFLALIVGVWKIRIRGYRPVKHLYEWFLNYPLLAMTYLTFTLMAWGVLGTHYGLRTLLLADDRRNQFLCGFSLMAVFLRLSFQYVVLDTSKQRWFWSLDVCLDVKYAIFGGDRIVRIMDDDGDPASETTLELPIRSIKALVKRYSLPGPEGDAGRFVMNSDRIRLAMAPLVMDFYAWILLAFLGFVPAVVIPFVSKSERMPIDWMLGCLAGWLVANALLRISIRQFPKAVAAQIASSDSERAVRLAQDWPPRSVLIDVLKATVADHAPQGRGGGSVSADASPHSADRGWTRPLGAFAAMLDKLWSRWETACWWFFAIHFSFLMLFSSNPIGSLRLLGEAVLAVVIVAVGPRVDLSEDRRISSQSGLQAAIARLRRFIADLQAAKESTVRSLRNLSGTATLIAFSLLSLVFVGAYASVLAVTRFDTILYLLQAIVGSIVIQFLATRSAGISDLQGRSRTAVVLAIIGFVAIPVICYRFAPDLGVRGVAAECALGMVKYLLMIVFGIAVVRWLMTKFDPLISYPVSAIFGFLAFASFFVELREPQQARIPAAFSAIYFAGFVASLMTCLMHWKMLNNPKLIGIWLIVLVLIVGQGWTTHPNQFKLRFPGLDGRSLFPEREAELLANRPEGFDYYDDPVRINSEAYFRISNRSVIKLHEQSESDFSDRDRKVVKSNRLASGIIPKNAPIAFDRDETLFSYFDETDDTRRRGVRIDYLRLRAGDPLELVKTDMRMHCRVTDDGKLTIALQDDQATRPLPSRVLKRLFEKAASLDVKLADEDELDSDVDLNLERDANSQWHVKFRGNEFEGSTVNFADDSIEIDGGVAEHLLAAMNPDHDKGLRHHRIAFALVTAKWDAVATERPGSDRSSGQRIVRNWVKWPLGVDLSDEVADQGFSSKLASFLHSGYLVSRGNSIFKLSEKPAVLRPRSDVDPAELSADMVSLLRDSVLVKGLGGDPNAWKPGDCLTFENGAWESPIRIADLLYLGPDWKIGAAWKKPLSPFLLTDESLWNAIAFDPRAYLKFDSAQVDDQAKDSVQADSAKDVRQQENERQKREMVLLLGTSPNRSRLTLRGSSNSGIFAYHASFDAVARSDASERVVAFYNHDRVRVGDRIVLGWRSGESAGEDRPAVATQTATFEIVDEAAGAAVKAESAPPAGHAFYRIRPVLTRGPGAGGAAAPPLQASLVASGRESFLAGTWKRLDLLDNYDVLNAWKAANRTIEQPRPKLVIVTVSGGGIRSSVWTATVLDKLKDEFGAVFPRSVRMITGASGGMVAASDFVGNVRAADSDRKHDKSPVDYLSENQLDSVIGQMVFADIPGLLFPVPHSEDRGRTLERTWARIARHEPNAVSPFERSLREFAAGEASGSRPSIVFTPMMVEDGRRLLISNLDLSFVTRNLSALLMEESSRKIKQAAYELKDTDRLINKADDLLSLSAIEFFRIFPEAWSFPVGTATRMSASFPWVSPAVSLPTIPPRRIVDAGYYDNYGVNLAALWLAEMREWLIQNTSGILLIQIRDHESQTARTDIDFDVDPDKDKSRFRAYFDKITFDVLERNVKPGLYPVTTPLSGVTAARQWTMSFRNDEQVELLDEIFNDEDDNRRDFFRTVVFECPVSASLSWNLNDEEKTMIRSGFGGEKEGQTPSSRPIASKSETTTPEESNAIRIAGYRQELEKLGFEKSTIRRLNETQLGELRKNVIGNRKRIQLLKNWWYGSRGS
jgi:hypothetical protein